MPAIPRYKVSKGAKPQELAATVVNSRRFRLRAAPLVWAVPLGAAILVGAAGLYGSRAIEDRISQTVGRELMARRNGITYAIGAWTAGEVAEAALIAGRRTFRTAAYAMMGPDGRRVADLDPVIAADLQTAIEQAHFEGYAIVTRSGTVLTSTPRFDIAMPLRAAQQQMLSSVFEGAARIFPPTQGSRVADEKTFHILIGAPILDAEDRPALAMLFQSSPDREFTRVSSFARTGDTGDNLVFDQDGLVLNDVRFEEDLRAAGLLDKDASSAGRLEARDPGGNILEGYRPDASSYPMPPMWPLAELQRGQREGMSLVPFADYRGVPVVGAFRWLPDLQIGVVAQMDAAEAFASLKQVRSIFWSVFIALLGAGFLMTAGSIIRANTQVARLKEAGSYQLLGRIGAGAMGTVYLAQHALLRRPTAVKILEASTAEAMQRFEREVQVTSELSHANTIAIYDYGRTDEGLLYYAMEYIEGIDLAELINSDGPVPPARVIHILRQVCGSLGEAHSRGLVHRDIKPSNIMLALRGGEGDVIKVVDFGLAKPVEPALGIDLTREGCIFGTPGFIPPETLRDPSTFDARGDLYAVGALGFELLAGKPPFDRTGVIEMWHLHTEVAPPTPSVRLGKPVPPDLERLVMRLLAKDPAHRPQTAIEVLDLLDACAQDRAWTQAQARAWWDVKGRAYLNRQFDPVHGASPLHPTQRDFKAAPQQG